MPDINDIYASKHLRAQDLKHPVAVTIDRVEMEPVGQGAEQSMKPIVYFRGKQKSLVCNRTNAAMIAHIAGESDTDNWAGTKVVLAVEQVTYQGSLVPAIRVRDPKPQKPVVEDDGAIPF